MGSEPILLDRSPTATAPARLDWVTLVDAFEAACLLRCAPQPLTERQRRTTTGAPTGAFEFSRADAAQRMIDLLAGLEIPVLHEVDTGGLRRRYQVHRLRVPEPYRNGYQAVLDAGWRQGRRELLGQLTPGASTARPLWRPRLASAAWRSALLAAGRHVRRHILGVRLTDRDLAAVLVRSATLLEVPARLASGGGCFVVSVADGADRDRILTCATQEQPAPRASRFGTRTPSRTRPHR